jgi:hypothetical protein
MEVLSSKAAAQVLADALPDHDAEYWFRWLANNRNMTRTPVYRIPFQIIAGLRAAHYELGELQKFVEFNKRLKAGVVSKRTQTIINAFGIGEDGGSTQGREFDVQAVVPKTISREHGDDFFVQIVTRNPLRVHRVSIEDALFLQTELNKAMVELECMMNESDSVKAAREVMKKDKPQ